MQKRFQNPWNHDPTQLGFLIGQLFWNCSLVRPRGSIWFEVIRFSDQATFLFYVFATFLT